MVINLLFVPSIHIVLHDSFRAHEVRTVVGIRMLNVALLCYKAAQRVQERECGEVWSNFLVDSMGSHTSHDTPITL